MSCSNYLTGGSEFEMTPELRVYGVILGAILAILAVTGNTLVMLAIYRTASLQNITNYFLASLAVADFCVGIIALPAWLAWFIISSDSGRKSEVQHLSVFVDIIYMQSFTASTYNLCAVTIDRYIAVRLPLRYHSLMIVKTLLRIVLCVWIFSILSGFIRLITDGHLFWMVTTSVAFVVPFAVIAYCYVYMLKEARRQNRDTSERTVGEMAAQAQNHKAAVTVAIVIGVFLLFTLPMIVVTVTEAIMEFVGLCELEAAFERGSVWAFLVSFSNSAMNPLIYSARKKEFRDAIKKIICRRNTANAGQQIENDGFSFPTDVGHVQISGPGTSVILTFQRRQEKTFKCTAPGPEDHIHVSLWQSPDLGS